MIGWLYFRECIRTLLPWCCTDPEVPSTMGVVRSFLHKVSKERMIAAGAKIPDKEQVCMYVVIIHNVIIPPHIPGNVLHNQDGVFICRGC